LTAVQRSNVLNNIDMIATSFDNEIYTKVRDVFGSEWSPGIDNDVKITILAARMQDNLGGYFREEDQFYRSQIPNSNQREMFYINTNFLGSTRQLEAFLAHEFQHLIHFNQKNRLLNTRSETWLNEMMSEVAPTVAGLNDSYSGSNLQSRIQSFTNTPSDAITRWNNNQEDYSAISAFGHYLLGQYGVEFYKALVQSTEEGIGAVNDALAGIGAPERFGAVFNNWVVASLVNNCNVTPFDTFCYSLPSLTYNNLHISFQSGTEGGKRVSSTETTFPWQGNWFSYSRAFQSELPQDHILVYTIDKPSGYEFSVPYVIYPKTGQPQVFYAEFSGNRSRFYIEEFGYNVDELVVMPVFELNDDRTPLVNYSLVAELATAIPTDATQVQPASDVSVTLPEGALVRAEGDEKVYIIKGKYKRWVQTAEIFNMYGHLRWEDVITVAPEVLEDYTESTVVSAAGDERVFFVSLNGRKRWIQTEQELFDLGFNFDMVYTINERELNYYQQI
ncbi:MAG: hypothetical protein R3251_02370, partial [Candidatus Spechtbacterales bacterium]|nr:hypothetical protein [Candidatus Spechtbacterales bacterium]